MRRFLLVVVCFLLVAATPEEVVPELEANGYYIEPGSGASEEVVSDAVFEGRSDGGRLYLVVLSEEPGGGATTFSDSVLDRLGSGYVVTVAPETVGFAGDSTSWTADEMNAALDASLEGGSDDAVVELFIAELTGAVVAPSPGGEEPDQEGGGWGWVWLVVIGGGLLLIFSAMRNSSRKRSELATSELEKVRAMARAKLAEIANDIIEMEHEVELSDNSEVKAHYQSASATYTEVLARIEKSPAASEMVDIVRDLDIAIWELDAAEALLDGKPVPEKPKPPEPKAPPPRPPATAQQEDPQADSYGRRPERQSSYAGNDLMSALWALLALSGRGGGGWGGMPGGFGGPMGGGGGGGRMRGGGMRLGGGIGRIRGGGRRR
jgi:hypothetical protein